MSEWYFLLWGSGGELLFDYCDYSICMWNSGLVHRMMKTNLDLLSCPSHTGPLAADRIDHRRNAPLSTDLLRRASPTARFLHFPLYRPD